MSAPSELHEKLDQLFDAHTAIGIFGLSTDEDTILAQLFFPRRAPLALLAVAITVLTKAKIDDPDLPSQLPIEAMIDVLNVFLNNDGDAHVEH